MNFPLLSSHRLAHTLAVVAVTYSGASYAQRGMTDIPDPAVDVQLKAFQTIEGAEINLFAHEPAVANPTHMNWDSQGRLWVVSSPLYPHIKPGEEEQDKIVVIEDTDGDGVADKWTDFATDLHIPTAVLPGDGGAYVANSVEVLFLKDNDGDGVADERRVVLSGFGTEDTHHLVHTFRWGPEGMMWLNQSIYIHTHLETPYGIRRLLGGGMWHYRPETERIEVFMKGLVNPWGHVFDEWGQSFLTDGAGGQGINYVFPRSVFMTSPGASRILQGLSPGQPKHCGLEHLLSSHLPEHLQGAMAAPDFRGNRINLFRLAPQGSSYAASQLDDLVTSTHRAFRPIDIKVGPDGALYVADWYNPIIQHGEVDFRDPRRDQKHGRIWRISFPGRPTVKSPNFAQLSEADLVDQLHSTEGYSRQMATAELRVRDADAVSQALAAWQPDEGTSDGELASLRQVWASQAINRFDAEAAKQLTHAQDHRVRAGALRALYYDAAESEGLLDIATKAVSDPNAQVRLWAVSLLAQLDAPDTVKLALKALDGVAVDDPLDFAVWSIVREHADQWTHTVGETHPFANLQQLLFAGRALNQPIGVPLILRGLDEGTFADAHQVGLVADWISKVGDASHLDHLLNYAVREQATPAEQTVILKALLDAGRLRKLQPSGDINRLNAFLSSNDTATFSAAGALAGLWKLQTARASLEKAFLQADQNEGRARAAIDGLVALGGEATSALFQATAADANASHRLRSLAVIGQARRNPKEGAAIAIAVLKDSPQGADPHGIFDTFLANQNGTAALTEALKGQELPAEIALTGVQKASSAATKPEALVTALQASAKLKPMKMQLTEEEMAEMVRRVAEHGDAHQGEDIYRIASLQCLVCHAIGGVGGVVGPDLVSIGASAPVDYLIDSLLQPSDKIKEGYHTTLVTTKNGNAVAGYLAREDENEVVIRDASGKENRLPKSDIENTVISPVSLMPPGLTASLREDQFVDLVRFLAELGKDGDFKTPSTRFIRSWEALLPHESTMDQVGHHGIAAFASENPEVTWVPAFAKVGGELPLAEWQGVKGRGRELFAVARTFLEVDQSRDIRLKIRGPLASLHLFHGSHKIELPASGQETEIVIKATVAGKQQLTVVARSDQQAPSFSLEVLNEVGAVTLP